MSSVKIPPPKAPPRTAKPRYWDKDDDDESGESDEESDNGDDEDDDDEFKDLEVKEEKWVKYQSKDGQIILFNPTASPKVVRLHVDDLLGDEDADRHKGWMDEIVQDNKVEEMNLEAVVDTLSEVVQKFDILIKQENNLSGEIIEKLQEVEEKMKVVHTSLEEGKMAFEEGNDINALLNQKKLDWNFENDHVNWYRETARNRCYDIRAFKNWHFPEYFSNSPIPPNLNKLKLCVLFPGKGGIKNYPSTLDKFTYVKIDLTLEDLVGKAISKAFLVIKGKGVGKESEYCFKAIGSEEYLHGSRRFGDYAYVRLRLRNKLVLDFRLMKIPKAFENAQVEVDKKENKSNTCYAPDDRLINLDSYSDLTLNKPWTINTLSYLPMSELAIPFCCEILGLDNLTRKTIPRLNNYNIKQIYLESFLFHGTTKYVPTKTKSISMTKSPRWNKRVTNANLVLSKLPREMRIAFILWGTTEDENIRLGWVVRQLVDHYGRFSTGDVQLNLWSFPGVERGKHKEREIDTHFIFRATNRDCHTKHASTVLSLKFPKFMLPVVAPICMSYRKPNIQAVGFKYQIPKKNNKLKELKMLIKEDSLYVLTANNRKMIWNLRHSLVRYPSMLPKFLQCVQWGIPDHKFEAYRFLDLWSPPFMMANALELLTEKFPDYRVREYAVNCLRRISDDELQLYLLQFTQCLKFEPYHDSPLSRFLIERAIRNPYVIGHYFFWHLKAELVDQTFTERCNVILEEFLMNCGRFSSELRKQNFAVLKLQRVSGHIANLRRELKYTADQAKKVYFGQLEKMNRSFLSKIGKFQIPLNPRWQAKELIIEKCNFFSSKMVPLYLVFRNADENTPEIRIIFKSGDDLRQDILTLELIRIMDRMWLAKGLDMRLTPYKVISTGINDAGKGVGMMECVFPAETISDIQIEHGGGALGALKLEPVANFLKKYNPEGEQYEEAVENFVASCAGYCVASYVLGIGDRHNGNIMVKKDGHLFHIDFGHFLGNFKTKFGIKRERTAFVFTTEMAYVMGGKNYRTSKRYNHFTDLCSKAFCVLRENAQIIETLFVLMVSGGMPELMMDSDVMYLKNMLHLDLDVDKAEKLFVSEIKKSLGNTSRRFDNLAHNIRHGK